MVLVSIFISNHNHFCVLCFCLAAACATTALWRTEILTQDAKDRHMNAGYGHTTPSLCLGTPVPRQKFSEFIIWRFTQSNRNVITHAAYAYSHFSLVAARSQKMETYKVDSCVRGHHVFRSIWTPTYRQGRSTTGCSFLWKNLCNSIYDLRLS